VVVLVMVLGGLFVLASGHSLAPTVSSPSGAHLAAGPAGTHGDLTVPAGKTFVIAPTPGSHTYYQGGNITVMSGGTLIVRNVTLSFVQFVSDTGTPSQRLSHIYQFNDLAGGTVLFYNSTVTTDVLVLNAWAKLDLTIQGSATAWNTTFAFPGWLNLEGASGSLTLNNSHVTANPLVPTLREPPAIQGDTEYAASVTVTGGAQLNLFNSTLNDTYADNTYVHNAPQPVPLSVLPGAGSVTIGSGITNFSSLYNPSDSANLTQDWLYPNADFQAGNVLGNYTNPSATTSTATVDVWYNGTAYAVGTVTFEGSSTNTFNLPLPGALLSAITADGMLNYLNWTGDFGVGPSKIAIQFDVTVGAGAEITAALSLLPSPQFNMVVSGVGSTLNSVDSSFALNWNSLPANATSRAVPYPWASNKLLLETHAVAYLANATIASGLPGVFRVSSVITDATSEAFFYRWAQFNLTGRGGVLRIPNAQVSAFYAYSNSQTDNQTANALNDLATANPEIWGYLHYWDQLHGAKGYGMSNSEGIAEVLLASSNLTSGTLPDGYFLGVYHIGIYVPAPGVGSKWFNWSVSAYPDRVAQVPPALASPDYGPALNFPSYFGGVSVSSLTVTANGVASSTIYLGQTVAVHLTVEDIGTVPITQLAGSFYYNWSKPLKDPLGSYNNTTIDLTNPGDTVTFVLTWVATANITGIGPAFHHTLTIELVWNNNDPREAGGNFSENVTETFAPTAVTVSTQVLANGAANQTVDLGQTLGVRVLVQDVGNGTISSFTVVLWYNRTAAIAWFNSTNFGLTDDRNTTITLSWVSTENITGLHEWFEHNLSLSIAWNNNNATKWLGNGVHSQNVSVIFAPSQIRFTAFDLPPSTIDLGTTYFSSGTIEYNGTHAASLVLTATPVGGGVPVVVASGVALTPGRFEMQWYNLQQISPSLSPGTSYTLTASGTYNGRSTNLTLAGTYTVPPTTSSPTSFLTQKVLGLPLWVWLAIAAAIVVGIVAFLLIARRQAAGRLVECGECGNLIPEDATVCPKCGAEFETDLLRCSRCASTIPADSKFCPECAAQLLGTPGEGKTDPERQAYADFTEKFRAEAKRELGDNYSEGGFWDWWKRQPTYTPFSQWSLQQGQGTARAGMTAPPAGAESPPPGATGGGAAMPPKGGGGAAGGGTWTEPSTTAPAAPPTPSEAAPTTTATVPAPAAGGAGLKACPSCGKEIPAEYLVCPFCNAVTQ
jgi:RNA polymerase subunit RPABC4/transcription elongation factor Spt4